MFFVFFLVTSCGAKFDGKNDALVEVDLLGDCFPAHVTDLERLGALGAGAVPAQEGHVAAPFHADAAAVRFLDLHDFALEVAQPVGGWLPLVLGVHQRFARDGDAPLDVHAAGETLLHPDAALFAGDLVLARFEHDQLELFVAHDALLRDGADHGRTAGRDGHRRGRRVLVRVLPSADMLG